MGFTFVDFATKKCSGMNPAVCKETENLQEKA